MKFKALAKEMLKAPIDRKNWSQKPDLFQMCDIWTGMEDRGILSELETVQTTFKKESREEEE